MEICPKSIKMQRYTVLYQNVKIKYFRCRAKQTSDANNTMASKRKTMFVIFVGPQQHGRPGTHYVASNGEVTDLRSQAAKFPSQGFAEEFAEERGIALTETKYIGKEEFTDFEIQMGNS